MTKEEIIARLRALKPELREIGISSISHFGLRARRSMIICEAARTRGPIAATKAPGRRWRANRGFSNVARHDDDPLRASHTWAIATAHLDDLRAAGTGAIRRREHAGEQRVSP